MSSGGGKEIINRLCSEIQLFDLCNLESCSSRSGRFCTDTDLLASFEAIKEEEERPQVVYEDEELDDDPDLLDDYEDYEMDESDDE